jgi:hypothetical protein
VKFWHRDFFSFLFDFSAGIVGHFLGHFYVLLICYFRASYSPFSGLPEYVYHVRNIYTKTIKIFNSFETFDFLRTHLGVFSDTFRSISMPFTCFVRHTLAVRMNLQGAAKRWESLFCIFSMFPGSYFRVL